MNPKIEWLCARLVEQNKTDGLLFVMQQIILYHIIKRLTDEKKGPNNQDFLPLHNPVLFGHILKHVQIHKIKWCTYVYLPCALLKPNKKHEAIPRFSRLLCCPQTVRCPDAGASKRRENNPGSPGTEWEQRSWGNQLGCFVSVVTGNAVANVNAERYKQLTMIWLGFWKKTGDGTEKCWFYRRVENIHIEINENHSLSLFSFCDLWSATPTATARSRSGRLTG